MKKYLICFLFPIIIWCCTDEKELIPSPEPEFTYVLPQGDHDYDAVIVDYYNRYGCYFLYKYSLEHAYWNVNQSLNIMNTITLPNEKQIGKLLDLVDRKFLSHYPDTLLKRTLPLRIFLTEKIKDNFWGDNHTTLLGYRSLFISGAEEIEYTSDFINKFKISMQKEYITSFLAKNIAISTDFKQVSTLYYGMNFGSKPSYINGFLSKGGAATPLTDWMDYIQLAATQTRDDITSTYLINSVDKNGFIRKKYEIVLDYMLKNHHVDLERVGNDVEK